jgi:hypothetical protein
MGLYDIRFEGLSKTSSDFLKRVLNVFSGKYYRLRNPIWRFEVCPLCPNCPKPGPTRRRAAGGSLNTNPHRFYKYPLLH